MTELEDMKQTWDDLDVREVEGMLGSVDVSWWEYHEGFDTEADFPELESLGVMRHVESVGGTDGSGEYMAVVMRLGSRTFRKEGHYASWDNDRWDGPFREVRPVQRMVTIWEEMK